MAWCHNDRVSLSTEAIPEVLGVAAHPADYADASHVAELTEIGDASAGVRGDGNPRSPATSEGCEQALVDRFLKQCPRQEQKRDAEIDYDPRDIDERRYEGR